MRRASEHLSVLVGQRGELRGGLCLRLQSEGRAVSGKGDAADKELRAVGKCNTGICKARQRVVGPGCPNGCGPAARRLVIGRADPVGWAAEDGGVAETHRPEEPGRREGRGWSLDYWRGTEADLGRIVEEGKVVSAQLVVAEDKIRITTQVELHKGRIFIKGAEDQLGRYQAPWWS